MSDDAALKTFADRLDAYGPELSRWPEGEAGAARALMLRSAEAAALHDVARRLAGLVARAAESTPANGLAFRIVGEVAARRSDRLGWFAGSARRFGLAGAGFGAAAFALGVMLAFAEPAAPEGLDLGAAFEVSLATGDL